MHYLLFLPIILLFCLHSRKSGFIFSYCQKTTKHQNDIYDVKRLSNVTSESKIVVFLLVFSLKITGWFTNNILKVQIAEVKIETTKNEVKYLQKEKLIFSKNKNSVPENISKKGSAGSMSQCVGYDVEIITGINIAITLKSQYMRGNIGLWECLFYP